MSEKSLKPADFTAVAREASHRPRSGHCTLKHPRTSVLSNDRLSPFYRDDRGIHSLHDHLHPEQKLQGLLNSGLYLLKLLPQPNTTVYHFFLERVGLVGGRKLDATIALLDQALKVGQKVVFISYRWSKDTDPQVDQLCEALSKTGILVLRDKESFEFGERIDEYMDLIKHPALSQTIILVDREDEYGRCYVKSRNCMYEMQLAFKNRHLAKQRAVVIPLSANCLIEYSEKSKSIEMEWRQRYTKFLQQGNVEEAKLAERVLYLWPVFLAQGRVQSYATLSQMKEQDYVFLIEKIQQSQPVKDFRSLSLPFEANLYSIPCPLTLEIEFHEHIIPGFVTQIIGSRGSGKTHFVKEGLLNLGHDLFCLFPGGIFFIQIDKDKTQDLIISQISQTITQDLSSKPSTNFQPSLTPTLMSRTLR
eukprot:TRINITY_DN175_c0_g2_i1.p1 TRINITY_DN175_c0_g2~~TRINITY_DN175_c0_g2_i1.p1  ORF type:complete len:456 (-),score=51.12 TRINITY_DN175_c0_g2_i1:4-1260(-)